MLILPTRLYVHSSFAPTSQNLLHLVNDLVNDRNDIRRPCLWREIHLSCHVELTPASSHALTAATHSLGVTTGTYWNTGRSPSVPQGCKFVESWNFPQVHPPVTLVVTLVILHPGTFSMGMIDSYCRCRPSAGLLMQDFPLSFSQIPFTFALH